MHSCAFILKPFPSTAPLPLLKLTGSISRSPGLLRVDYELSGPLASISFPPVAEYPSRRHGLWEETCFELFVGTKGEEGYWEFNLSPSGDWNAFGFTGYRRDMHEETVYAAIPMEIEAGQDVFRLSAGIGLSGIIPGDHEAEVGISAVIKDKSGLCSYWALGHFGTRPDFHDRRGFLLNLS